MNVPRSTRFGPQRLFDNLRDAVVVVDAGNGRVALWNTAAGNLFGYTEAQARARGFRDLFPEAEAADSLRAAAAANQGGPEGNLHEVFVTRGVRADGQAVPVELHLCPVEDAALEGTFVLAVARDLPDGEGPEMDRLRIEARSHRAQIAALRAEGEERDREIHALRHPDGDPGLVMQFVAMASHDLFSPLTAVRLQMELLRTSMGRLTGPQDRAFEVINRNLQRMMMLNQDLLDAARLRAGRLNLDLRPMDLSTTLRNVAATYRVQAEQKGVRLALHAPEALPIVADPLRLEQAVGNLVDNAVKFTPANGSVHLQALRREEAARVEVQDTGPGVASEDVNRLFQPFSQLTAPNRSGTGLGLFICKGIVEAHGGRIGVTSAGRGRGSVFFLELPLGA